MSDLQKKHLKIQIDNNNIIEDDFIVGLFTNSLYIAGFKNANKDIIKLNDGLFEVLLIKMPQNLFELQAVISALLTDKVNGLDS